MFQHWGRYHAPGLSCKKRNEFNDHRIAEGKSGGGNGEYGCGLGGVLDLRQQDLRQQDYILNDAAIE